MRQSSEPVCQVTCMCQGRLILATSSSCEPIRVVWQIWWAAAWCCRNGVSMRVAMQSAHTPPLQRNGRASHEAPGNTETQLPSGQDVSIRPMRSSKLADSIQPRLSWLELCVEGQVCGGSRHKIEPSDPAPSRPSQGGKGGVAAARGQRWPELAESVPRQKMLSLFDCDICRECPIQCSTDCCHA